MQWCLMHRARQFGLKARPPDPPPRDTRMSAVVAGMTRGVAEVIDDFLRLPPMGVELQLLTGCRVQCDERSCVLSGSMEAAMAAWAAYPHVYVTVHQFIEIDDIRCWSDVRGIGVKWAGEPFPTRRRSTHRRYGGRVATIDAVYHAVVMVPAGRAWEHRRWLLTADNEEIEGAHEPNAAGELPVARDRVAGLIEELQAESDEEL